MRFLFLIIIALLLTPFVTARRREGFETEDPKDVLMLGFISLPTYVKIQFDYSYDDCHGRVPLSSFNISRYDLIVVSPEMEFEKGGKSGYGYGARISQQDIINIRNYVSNGGVFWLDLEANDIATAEVTDLLRSFGISPLNQYNPHRLLTFDMATHPIFNNLHYDETRGSIYIRSTHGINLHTNRYQPIYVTEDAIPLLWAENSPETEIYLAYSRLGGGIFLCSVGFNKGPLEYDYRYDNQQFIKNIFDWLLKGEPEPEYDFSNQHIDLNPEKDILLYMYDSTVKDYNPFTTLLWTNKLSYDIDTQSFGQTAETLSRYRIVFLTEVATNGLQTPEMYDITRYIYSGGVIIVQEADDTLLDPLSYKNLDFLLRFFSRFILDESLVTHHYGKWYEIDYGKGKFIYYLGEPHPERDRLKYIFEMAVEDTSFIDRLGELSNPQVKPTVTISYLAKYPEEMLDKEVGIQCFILLKTSLEGNPVFDLLGFLVGRIASIVPGMDLIVQGIVNWVQSETQFYVVVGLQEDDTSAMVVAGFPTPPPSMRLGYPVYLEGKLKKRSENDFYFEVSSFRYCQTNPYYMSTTEISNEFSQLLNERISTIGMVREVKDFEDSTFAKLGYELTNLNTGEVVDDQTVWVICPEREHLPEVKDLISVNGYVIPSSWPVVTTKPLLEASSIQYPQKVIISELGLYSIIIILLGWKAWIRFN